MTQPVAPPTSPLGPPLEFLQRLWQLNHALERVSAGMARRIGITAQQRLIVRCLGKYPGMSAGQLATLLHVDPGTVSAALRRLEAKKLVARKRDPRDQRRASLGLTAKGRGLDQRVPGTVEHAVERLLARAHADDIAATVRVLEQLSALLDEEHES